ncbi:hypothetical protein RirG_038320 [Rhizophagus irregularis DAOM 197198w]|uniref:Uncharacterized protein n=2 Tax=Rhizophagus irregularis TaxID=588596 RepID=A0A015K8J5_RHIIW|nr:hypothetical protein RirG_038320 [Rhizophagus irregularis DAOM 197198w]
MNEIFGNRENVRPDYLSSSISSESDINSDVKIKPSTSRNKRKISQIYLDALDSIKKGQNKKD